MLQSLTAVAWDRKLNSVSEERAERAGGRYVCVYMRYLWHVLLACAMKANNSDLSSLTNAWGPTYPCQIVIKT